MANRRLGRIKTVIKDVNCNPQLFLLFKFNKLLFINSLMYLIFCGANGRSRTALSKRGPISSVSSHKGSSPETKKTLLEGKTSKNLDKRIQRLEDFKNTAKKDFEVNRLN